MDAADRRHQIEDLCHQALERSPAERSAFVAAACGNDEALCREVEALLSHAHTGEGFLATPLEEMAARALTDESSVVGRSVGPYQISALLGSGGMGEVYRAHDTTLGRDVAIKILPASFATDREFLARLEGEARVLASLNHPNIATIYGIERANDTRAIVMELVNGETLAQRLASRQGRKRGASGLPISEALDIARQIATALEAAHEKGVVHRDLKPANIQVTPSGAVKVLDFGLAKLDTRSQAASDAAQSPTLSVGRTHDGVILGTAAYMSPEQARGQVVDKRTDLWAFGCVLYEMLTGHAAFVGDTVTDTLSAIIEREPHWQALPASTPAPVRRLLRRCLEKDRKRRLDSAAAARLEMDDVGVLTMEDVPATPPARQNDRRQIIVATLAGAVVAASAMASWHVWSRPQPVSSASSQFVIPAPAKLRFGNSPGVISPDGRTVVFVAAGPDGRSLLWLRPLDLLVPRPLAGTDEAMDPFWSPDSRTIAFFAQGKLKRVEAVGGPPQVIASVHPSASQYGGGSWSRDGTLVFSDLGSLFRVPAAGSPPSELPGLKGVRPSFLPDGRHFVFVSGISGDLSVYVGSLDSNEVKFIVHASSAAVYAPPGFLLFARRTTLMAQPFNVARLEPAGEAMPVIEEAPVTTPARLFVSVSDNATLVHGPALSGVSGQTELQWVDRHGTPVETVAGPAEYGNMALSPDGTRVAFDRLEGANMNVWVIDLQRRITSRFTFAPGVHNVPVWSPDGRSVVFATSTTSMDKLTSADNILLDIGQRPYNSSGAAEVLLKLDAPPILYPADWSLDGRFLAYYRTHPKTQLDLWVLPLFGDRKPIPMLQSEFNESQAQFSPDGKWIAYVSDESGAPQVYVQTFPTLSGKWQVSRDGGTQPRWRRDGKELFYLAADRKLTAVSIKRSDAFETDTPQPLFETALPFLQANIKRQTYAVSADGQRFLLNTPAAGPSSSLTVMLNWHEELKQRVPTR